MILVLFIDLDHQTRSTQASFSLVSICVQCSIYDILHDLARIRASIVSAFSILAFAWICLSFDDFPGFIEADGLDFSGMLCGSFAHML